MVKRKSADSIRNEFQTGFENRIIQIASSVMGQNPQESDRVGVRGIVPARKCRELAKFSGTWLAMTTLYVN